MLTASFCCFPGVSQAAELRLWAAGILSWQDFMREGQEVFSIQKTERIKRHIEEAAKALESGLWDYFIKRLPPAHRVRVLAHTGGREAYIDVESDGLGEAAEVTTVALATAGGVEVFVAGEDLSRFLEAVAGVDLVVSYNGGRFDVPMIERRFRMSLPCPHLDLLPVALAMGWRGGLKGCERWLGIKRPAEGAQNGYEAVLLWRRWVEHGERLALQLLVQYNAQDACSLQWLARAAYKRSMAGYPLEMHLPFSSG